MQQARQEGMQSAKASNPCHAHAGYGAADNFHCQGRHNHDAQVKVLGAGCSQPSIWQVTSYLWRMSPIQLSSVVECYPCGLACKICQHVSLFMQLNLSDSIFSMAVVSMCATCRQLAAGTMISKAAKRTSTCRRPSCHVLTSSSL